MGNFKEIEGDLIALAKKGKFMVITHGCNCFNTMGSGIAVPMKETFMVDKYELEGPKYKGDYNKLGQIDGQFNVKYGLDVVNSYTQYDYKRIPGVVNLDYQALAMCLKKLNKFYAGKHIGLPLIGAGLAGGDWDVIKSLIQIYLIDMDVTVVHYKK